MSTSTPFTISDTEPTPLLKDFSVFASYVSDKTVPLTSAQGFINGKDLYAINQRMTDPMPDRTPRSHQDVYPLLHLFYYIGLAGKLFVKTLIKGQKLVLRPTERLAQFKALTPTEQYFALLEMFWVDTDWMKIRGIDYGGRLLFNVNVVLDAACRLPPGRTVRMDRRSDATLSFESLRHWSYLLYHFSYFGLWNMIPAAQEGFYSKRHILPKSITMTPFGAAMLTILRSMRPTLYWNLPDRRALVGDWDIEPGAPIPENTYLGTLWNITTGTLEDMAPPAYKGKPGEPFFVPFAPLFSEGVLQRSLPRKAREFVNGAYVLKVSLDKDLWRRIELAAHHTLLDLHRAIQTAYRFDDDHLYSFFMDGQPWSDERFTAPDDDEGPHVNEAQLGKLDLSVGQTFLYLFDYGDEWRFQILVEDFRSEGPQPRKPKKTDSKGRAPRQYGW